MPEFVSSPSRLGVQVALVSRDDLVTEIDAANMMGRRRLVVPFNVTRGVLVPAAAPQGGGNGLLEGVTRSSVLEQIERRASATWFKRIWRALGWLVFHL